MTRDQRAERLAAIAQECAVRIRDEDPADVHRWLTSAIPDGEWLAAYVIACSAIPVDRPWRELLSWVTWPDGVPAASKSPRAYREHVDEVAVERACRGERVPLTRRERQLAVAKLRARGMTGVQIAQVLGLHRRTVRRLAQAEREVA